jgi:hypothetical protein
MNNLNDWAKKHRLYLKIEEGEPVTCRFIGFEEFVDKENDDKEKIRYHLEVGGDEKILESQSTGLAEEMSRAKKGGWIKLTRTGKGRQTKYAVETMKDPDED